MIVRTAADDAQGIHARIGERPWVAMYHAEGDMWRARIAPGNCAMAKFNHPRLAGHELR
ncbi:MAG: hypothetical protein ACLFU7_01520 [Armatimonadota bacterium]